MKYSRVYTKPQQSILLIGPRGTGKSTFIKEIAKPDLTIDLLKSSDLKLLQKDPSEIESMVAHLKPGQFVFIDEIQKIPDLLNETHRLIENKKLNFILSGSSARKLKKEGVNLLAGRARLRHMYPLTLKELNNHHDIQKVINFGTLPEAINCADLSSANDYLFSYVDTYLKEEIFQEGLTRNLNIFSKFIEVAGQYHGQILNYENISRQVEKSGDSIKAWFQILQDTLVGFFLEPYPLHLKPRESKHPKFYFFDPGIARAAEGIQNLKEFPEKVGFYLESIIINELKTYFEVHGLKHKIYYYNVPSFGDIDLIVEIKKKSISSPSQLITIEIKNSKKWETGFEKLSLFVKEEMKKQIIKQLAIYNGNHRLNKNGIDVFPIQVFIESLWQDEIF